MTDAIRKRIEASFARQSLMRTFDATVLDVQPGAVTIRAPITAAVGQQQGLAHAGLTFSLGDSAAGYAALSLMAPDLEVVTAEMKINLLNPARGQHLEAQGRVIKPGKRLSVVAADVFAIAADGTRLHVAALQGTMLPVEALA